MCLLSLLFAYLFGRKSKLVTSYLLLASLFEIAGFIFGELYGNNLFLIPLFSFIDYLIWSRFFTPTDFFSRKNLIWFDLLLGIYALIEIVLMLTEIKLFIIPSSSLCSLCIVAIMIYNYLKIIKIQSVMDWLIFSIVFVYASFNCFFGVFLEFLIFWDDKSKFIIWFMYSFILHIFYLVLPIYQWKIGKNPQNLSFG